MRAWSEFRVRVRALFGRGRMDRELDDELAFHIDKETEKQLARGLSPGAARREARQRFGGVDRHRERTREAWGIRAVEDIGRDVRVAIRRMARSPRFTVVASLTLALGVGGTVALFSVVHGLLLRPLPYADDDRLVVLWNDWNWRGVEFDFVNEHARVFDGLAAYTLEGATLRLESGSVPLTVGLTSAELFEVLGATPLLGRTFRPGEDRPGAAPVAVVSHAMWQQELGGDAAIVGRGIMLDGVLTTVVGVMAPEFYFPVPDVRAWRPLLLDADSPVYQGRGWLVFFGRVGRGITEPQLHADLNAIAAALGERFTYPDAWDPTRAPDVRPLREYLFGDVKPAVLLLLGAAGLLLVMATANIAALILARTADRTTEMELRASLGASRSRLARQILTETLLLGASAGLLGVAFAAGGFELLVSRLPLRDGVDGTLALEWPMFVGGLLLACLAGAAVALGPIWGLVTGALGRLRPVARGATGARGRSSDLQRVLVAAEVVLAVVLVTGATLFTRSVTRLYDVDLGLDPRGVGAVDVVIGGNEEISAGEVETFLQLAVERVQALPGVESAALTVRLPLRDDGVQGSIAVEDRPDLTGALAPSSYWRPVTSGYFRTLGIAMIEGRGFTTADRTGAPRVAIVSARLAREMWPGQSAIGKRVVPTGFEGNEWATVVGVADDVPVSGVRAAPPSILYRPHAQMTFPWHGGYSLVFRTRHDPATLLQAVQRTLRDADPRIALARPTTLDDVVAASIGDVLQVRFFLGLLAAVALIVGTMGVYGVVSYSVSRRTAEYGVRMALGASTRQIVAGVLAREIVPVGIGVAAGLGAALVAARAAAGLLWDLDPADPPSLAVGTGVLLVTGLVAALLPAIRASRASPSATLRKE